MPPLLLYEERGKDMTIGQAIQLVDRLKPNSYSDALKISWLSKLDGQINIEIFRTHEGNPLITEENETGEFTGYVPDSPQDTELLVPFPYDEDVYSYYLQARIDQENAEIAKYNQSIALYNSAINAFQSAWNRTHLPLCSGTHFRF